MASASNDAASMKHLMNAADAAETAKQYEDMVGAVSAMAKKGQTLTVDQRNSFSVAFKHTVGRQRGGWRILESIKQAELRKHGADSWQAGAVDEYMGKVAAEIVHTCKELLHLVNNHLIPTDSTVTGKVFYHKMAGDYNRYLAEISTEKAQRDAIKAAEDSYNKAQALADSNITDVPYPHPLRLGLALNRAVLYYEIINDTNKAIQICKTAVDEGVEDISKLIDQQYKDATLIMQLLRDNIAMWES